MSNLPNITELQTYPSKEILSAHQHICEFFKRTGFEIPNEAFKKTFLSALVSANKSNDDKFTEKQISWEELFIREVNWACSHKATPEEAWDYISNQVFTKEVIKQYPELDKKGVDRKEWRKTDCDVEPGREIKKRPLSDYALSKPRLAKKRGKKWKEDDRWEKVWPSSRKIIKELWYRMHFPGNKKTFPYAYAGIKSLVKVTGLEERQVRRGLRQLQALGMIARMFRAYKGMGASKYWVFLTPKQSGAFLKKAAGKSKN
jgi:hypothetical protein